jgi:hypothetical protein
MTPDLKISVQREPWSDGVAVYIKAKTSPEGEPIRAFALPLQFKTVAPGAFGMQPEPCMHLSLDSAQRLIDELWGAGLRPTEGTGSAGSLAATQRHLEDMRTLVFQPKAQ